jgi:hypothetical protein
MVLVRQESEASINSGTSIAAAPSAAASDAASNNDTEMEIDAGVEVQKGIEASGNSGTTHPTAGTTSSIIIRKIPVTPSENATNNTTHTTPTSTPTLQSISLHFDQTTDNEPKSPLSGNTTEERLASSFLSISLTQTNSFVLGNYPTTSTPFIQNNLIDYKENNTVVTDSETEEKETEEAGAGETNTLTTTTTQKTETETNKQEEDDESDKETSEDENAKNNSNLVNKYKYTE